MAVIIHTMLVAATDFDWSEEDAVT